MLKIFQPKIKIVTHDATFHADDIFATACLKIYYGKLKNRKVKIIRTRDTKIIETADVVYDVGQIYDPIINKYDHHQKGGALKRENGVPYSAFGLIWKHFGPELVSSSEIHQEIDDDFVQQICASDTGFIDFKIIGIDWSAWTFNKVVKMFQAKDINSKNQLKNFKTVAKVAEKILEKIIETKEKQFADMDAVLKIYEKSPNKKIIILDKPDLSWKRVLVEKPEPLFVIFQSSNKKDYHIQAVSKSHDSIESRQLFPEQWRGLDEKSLAEVTGLEGLKFVHNAGFLAVVDSLEHAIKVAENALEA